VEVGGIEPPWEEKELSVLLAQSVFKIYFLRGKTDKPLKKLGSKFRF